jgi:hypothetical protein
MYNINNFCLWEFHNYQHTILSMQSMYSFNVFRNILEIWMTFKPNISHHGFIHYFCEVVQIMDIIALVQNLCLKHNTFLLFDTSPPFLWISICIKIPNFANKMLEFKTGM